MYIDQKNNINGNKNYQNLSISVPFFNMPETNKKYETTYETSYGNFHPNKCCKTKPNLKNETNTNDKSVNFNNNYILLNQTKKNIPNSESICPNCINDNLAQMRSISRSRSRIKRLSDVSDIFEDKMRGLHKKKLEQDRQNRENRTKNTYYSLFDNRHRSTEYKKIYVSKTDNNISREGEYFGKDIDYGMLRCRNREIKNDKKIFGINLNNNKSHLYNKINSRINNNFLNYNNHKSFIGKNYLLNKLEYSQIIDDQIEKNTRKYWNEKFMKIKEERNLLKEQLENEKETINHEKEKKMKIRNEMNRVNSVILKNKKMREYNEQLLKRKEKEKINNLCKKENEDYAKNLQLQKIKNQKIDEDNFKSATIVAKKMKKKDDKIYPGLNLEGISNTINIKCKCDQCFRKFPKNVMSQIYYSYTEQQKKK